MRNALACAALFLLACTTRNPLYLSPDNDAGFDLASDATPSDLGPMPDFSTATCGVPGLTCCGGNACSVGCCGPGGKCVDVGESCSSGVRRVCTTGGCVDCGAPNQPCCTNGLCGDGAGCDSTSNVCVACGGPGEDCCPGDRCAGGGCCLSDKTCAASGRECGSSLVCSDSQCISCGAGGEACCENNACAGGGCCGSMNLCIAPGSTCALGMCTAGSCAGCGGLGQSCCSLLGLGNSPYCSAPGTVCDGVPGVATCQTCGGAGQPCCENNGCSAGGCCVDGTCAAANTTCGNGLGTCVAGSCGTCGSVGQQCCEISSGGPNRSFCTEPNSRCLTNNPLCQPCGGHGQRCCYDYQTNSPRGCASPYQPTTQMGICFCQ